MFLLFFIYGIILGIFLYLIFKQNLLTLLFYVVIFELFIFLLYVKFRLNYDPFIRLGYILFLLLGYFSGFFMYGYINFNDPNIPNIFN